VNNLIAFRKLINNNDNVWCDIDGMIWHSKLEVGWYPCNTDGVYDEEYFNNYLKYKNTETGKKITQFRTDFVNKIYDGDLIDFGSGSGQFVESRSKTFGIDVNPFSVSALKTIGKYCDQIPSNPRAISFWDSLEHIKDCWDIVETISEYVFVSIPIFVSMIHALRSKHFKPKEHYWYFTEKGLIECFLLMGFSLVERSDFETRYCGRDMVYTYCFKRII